MPSSRDVPELVETLNDHPKYGLVLEGTICPWISKRQTQKRKNINALSLQLATFIKVPSQASGLTSGQKEGSESH